MIRRKGLQTGFESIDGGEEIQEESTATDGIAVDTVIEAGEGGDEVGALASDIESASASIEDMLGVDEGLAEEQTKIEETIDADPTEITGDTVVAANEALAQAIAISGVDMKRSSMGFEAIGSNPKRALTVALEDYKDFFKRLWAQIKEFFKKLMLGFKKMFVAVMKWTAADVDACDKLIKKINEGKEIAAISQKDGTIFKSTKTKIQRSLGGYLAAVGHKDVSGSNFQTSMIAVMNLVNDTGAFKAMNKTADALAKSNVTGDMSVAFDSGAKGVKYENFAEKPEGDIISVTVNANSISVMYNKGDKKGETKKINVKADFVSGIELKDINSNSLVATLNALKKRVQDNKKYFDEASKTIENIDKCAEAVMKKLEGDESAEKWARINSKIIMRLAKSGVYDSVLNQIRANKAVLSVCKTIATGKADKEEKKD